MREKAILLQILGILMGLAQWECLAGQRVKSRSVNERPGSENFWPKQSKKKVLSCVFLEKTCKKRHFWKGFPAELLGFYGRFPDPRAIIYS
jgi:hypothetical protein